MSNWTDYIRHLQVNLIEYSDAQRWALVEVRFELKLSSPFRPNEVQIGLYCDGSEIAVGDADTQGKWLVRIEGLQRPAPEIIFEAHARISLKRARSERKTVYEVKRGALEAVEVKDTRGGASERQLQMCLPEMIKIKAGNYWMGRGATSHRVRISRPMLVSATQVTQELFSLVMGDNPSGFEGEKRPVERVSFWDALEFCNQLSERVGESAPYRLYEEGGKRCAEWLRSSKGYRLLTEAEWEYTAKAGREALYAGNSALSELAWYQENSRNKTQPVGQKSPNDWGLYDLSGNVWEWCYDQWDEYAYDLRLGEQHVDPVVLKKPSATKRVKRGGCWLDFPPSCSTSHRFWGPATQRQDDTGFRVAKTL